MATYPGMNLRGEVRESVSLDEDDLSDVEDEVFIRDGKHGYKFEDISVKKPLMAPRRKMGARSDLGSRIRARPPCRAMCKLCCYAFIALTVLIGLIILVVILVSLFPLPLDKLKQWIISKTNEKEQLPKLIPCSNLKITQIWSLNLPKFSSESSVQMLDVNQDGIKDILFGFGIGDDNTLPPELFCSIFMNMSPPCTGGVIALNGSNGNILWKHWLSHSVFNLVCTVDVNGDNITDCLITGKGGIFSVINSFNGTLIWNFSTDTKDAGLIMDVYWANFIPDQDNDTISDILASHTSQKDGSRTGHILVISGKTGAEIQRVATPNNVEIYYTPQLILNQTNGTNYSVLFGTGSPTMPGNLSLVPLKEILAGNMTPQVLYQDTHKGILSPSILVDITGDRIPDIISATFNSTIIAIDGKSLKQIWNFTIPNSETLSVPTPGYFNDDNVTDFLVKYQTGPNFPTYYYSQTFIIDGKKGKPIYVKPINDSVGSQMGGLTLSMERHGFDFFLYWTADCKNFEGNRDIYEFIPGSRIQQQSRADICKLRYNSSMVARMYALNQFDQPPGLEIYNSENNILLEYNNTKSPLDEARDYFSRHPSEMRFTPSTTDGEADDQDYEQVQEEPFKNIKYKDGSSFRHKDNGQGLIRDFSRDDLKRRKNPEHQKFETDYEQPVENWQQKINAAFPPPAVIAAAAAAGAGNGAGNEDLEADYNNNYLDDSESAYNPSKLLLNGGSNRDPRSKAAITSPAAVVVEEDDDDDEESRLRKTLKKNLSEEQRPSRYGSIYDYKNIKKSRTRLLNDLNNLPNEILRDTYFKNREHQLLKKSRFEQRDVKMHHDNTENIFKIIENEKKASRNLSESLWDLESEKEWQDKENGYWRGKRQINYSGVYGIPRLTSVGALTSSLNTTKNSIDLILVTYWLPPKNGAQILLDKDFKCINEKIKQAEDPKVAAAATNQDHNYKNKATLEELFMKECLQERGVRLNLNNNAGGPAGPGATGSNGGGAATESFPYMKRISQISLGQMTVYRLRLECQCNSNVVMKKDERCVRFLKDDDQRWPSYLGKLQDGVFKTVTV